MQAAFNYYEAHPQEVDQAIADNDAMSYDKLKRLLPQLEAIVIPQSVPEREIGS